MSVRRYIVAVLALTLTSIIMIGCQAEEVGTKGVTITYWPSTNPYEITLARELVAEWNVAHPDTQVAMQPLPEGRSGEEVLIIAAAGQTAPDICSNVPPIIVPLLAKAKALIPVDRFENGRQVLKDRVPNKLLETFVASDDSLYQIPWKGNPILVQYNLSIMEEVGLDSLPQTWSEWCHASELVSIDRDGDGVQDRWMADLNITAEWRQRLFDVYPFYIMASGGQTFLNHQGDFGIDRKVMGNVFDLFAEGYEKGYYPNSMIMGHMFLQGYFGAHITGPWNIATTERLKPEGFRYGFGPIPRPDNFEGQPSTFGDPKSIGIFSTTKHPEAAWNFVRFLISKQSDRRLMEVANQLPLRDGLTSDSLFQSYFDANPMMVTFADWVPNTRGFDQSPAMQEVFDAINEQFDAACIQRMRDVDDALDRAFERSTKILRARGR